SGAQLLVGAPAGFSAGSHRVAAAARPRKAQNWRLKSFLKKGTSTRPWARTATTKSSTPGWYGRQPEDPWNHPESVAMTVFTISQPKATRPRRPVSVQKFSRMLWG